MNYVGLGQETADMAVELLTEGKTASDMAVRTMDTGIVTINTETAEALGMDYSVFKDMCTELVEVTTAEEFE